MIQLTTQSGRQTHFEYYANGLQKSIIDSLRGKISFEYDHKNNLTALVDQRGNILTFVYDRLNRLIMRRDPSGAEVRYTYDSLGNTISILNRLSNQTKIDYDALNRPHLITYSDSIVTYNYDKAGRLIRINDSQSGTIDRIYDNANRLILEKTLQGIITYTYNKANQRVTMSVSGQPVVYYTYDYAGRLKSTKQGNDVFTWTYDDLSRIISLSRSNNIITNYKYDSLGNLQQMQHLNVISGVPLEDFKYTYNADNEIDTIASLVSSTALSTERIASNANATNRILQYGPDNYTFDREGHTVTKTNSRGTTIFDWDARGRLTTAKMPDGQTINYRYDSFGRLIQRTTNYQVTDFLYDFDDIVQDKINNNTYINYLTGPSIDDRLKNYLETKNSNNQRKLGK